MLSLPGTSGRHVLQTSPKPSDNPYDLFSPLPSTSAADLGVDPALERTIPGHVLDRPVQQVVSMSGAATLYAFGSSEGIRVIVLLAGERVPRFYQKLGIGLHEVTAAWGITQFPGGFPLDGRTQIFAFHVPGAKPKQLVDDWIAVTQQSMEFYELNAKFGPRPVTIIDTGFEAETLYASGDVLYLIYTSGVFDPDFSRYVGALVGELP